MKFIKHIQLTFIIILLLNQIFVSYGQDFEIIGHSSDITGISFIEDNIYSSSESYNFLVKWVENENGYTPITINPNDVGITYMNYINEIDEMITSDRDGMVNSFIPGEDTISHSIGLNGEIVINSFYNTSNLVLITNVGNLYSWTDNDLNRLVSLNTSELQEFHYSDETSYIVTERRIDQINSTDYSQIQGIDFNTDIEISYYNQKNGELVISFENSTIAQFNTNLTLIESHNIATVVKKITFIEPENTYFLGLETGTVLSLESGEIDIVFTHLNIEITYIQDNEKDLIAIGYQNGSLVIYSLNDSQFQVLGGLEQISQPGITGFDIILTLLIPILILITILIVYLKSRRGSKPNQNELQWPENP